MSEQVKAPGEVLFEAILKRYPLWSMVKYSELSKATKNHWDEFAIAGHAAVERNRQLLCAVCRNRPPAKDASLCVECRAFWDQKH